MYASWHSKQLLVIKILATHLLKLVILMDSLANNKNDTYQSHAYENTTI